MNGTSHNPSFADESVRENKNITFVKESVSESMPPEENTAWDALTQLVESCVVETGVTDLAHQHDHYLYGKPKRE